MLWLLPMSRAEMDRKESLDENSREEDWRRSELPARDCC